MIFSLDISDKNGFKRPMFKSMEKQKTNDGGRRQGKEEHQWMERLQRALNMVVRKRKCSRAALINQAKL